MAHEDLVNEVTRQLIPRFRPNPIDIKKQIAGLIEVGGFLSPSARKVHRIPS